MDEACRSPIPLPYPRDDDRHAGAEEVRALATGLASGSVVAPSLLRLTGVDHREALDRVVSQDVKRLPAGDGKLALVLAPKGQFRALLAVFGGPDELLLAAPRGRGQALESALGTYLRFSKSRLDPVARVPRAVVLAGPHWADAVAACGADADVLARGGWLRLGRGETTVDWLGQTFLGVPGAAVVATSEDLLVAIEDEARSSGATHVGGEVLELERIRVGFPAWGAELTDTVLPPEVGIQDAAISYSKGCYVGQETVARMRTYGHPNRRLVGIRVIEGTGEPPTPLDLCAEGDDRTRGGLTSFAVHPELGGVGLALVRRELAAPGTRLTGGPWTFETASLPLW